ncbi:MAG: histidine utilization repressor [Gammaproteobacteria bacterium]|nr:histidine utilization repressor [Gammaproteobacteria bacterium]
MSALLDSFDDISKAAPEPIYLQIKNTIERRIESGEWPAGQKLPSENELVDALGVSRMTINRALRELTQQGLVRRVHGIGSFVAEAPRHASLIELQDIALEIEQRGRRYGTEVLLQEEIPAPAEVAAQMELPAGSPVFHLHALHLQDDLPLQLENRYVNPRAMPEFIAQDFTRVTATTYLLQQFKPDEMEHRVSAVMPDAATRRRLALNDGQPCLQLTRRTWKDARVVTHVTLTYPGERYELGARYATDQYSLR